MKTQHNYSRYVVIVLIAQLFVPIINAHASAPLTSYMGNASPILTDNYTQLYSCTIDAVSGTSTCGDAVQLIAGTPGRGTYKIAMDYTKNYLVAQVQASFAQTGSGWQFAIGDSSSNDGWGGDASTQENDTELMVTNGRSVALYGSDKIDTGYSNLVVQDPLSTTPANRSVYLTRDFAVAGKTMVATIANEYTDIAIPGSNYQKQVFRSPVLYALCGQSDNQGNINSDIYIGVNQMIGGRGRTGQGLEKIQITLYGNPKRPDYGNYVYSTDGCVASPSTPTVTNTTQTPRTSTNRTQAENNTTVRVVQNNDWKVIRRNNISVQIPKDFKVYNVKKYNPETKRYTVTPTVRGIAPDGTKVVIPIDKKLVETKIDTPPVRKETPTCGDTCPTVPTTKDTATPVRDTNIVSPTKVDTPSTSQDTVPQTSTPRVPVYDYPGGSDYVPTKDDIIRRIIDSAQVADYSKLQKIQ